MFADSVRRGTRILIGTRWRNTQNQLICRSSQLSRDTLQTSTPLAETLKKTGLWDYGRWAKKEAKKAPRVKGDRNRVNIVSEELCDDVLSYFKPSLERHTGCDLIDIYPGAGLWSRKLHDTIRPRSHLLLEPDETLYRPLLQPLLDRPNTSLVSKSGIIWHELNDVLNQIYLPLQHERMIKDGDSPQRNDSLLITANLAFHPKRRFAMFESLTQLVLYQFISSIRTSSLFNKYGLVRMLLWVGGSDRHALLARSCQRRRRLAIEAELATQSITEIAGPDDHSPWFVRDQALDMASCQRVSKVMAASGVDIPPGRAPKHVLEATAGRYADMDHGPAVYDRPWREEQKLLAAQFEANRFTMKSEKYRRLLQLQYRGTQESKAAHAIHLMLEKRDNLVIAMEAGNSGQSDLQKKEAEWNSEVDALPASKRKEFLLQRDNLHLFRQDPPVLAWDRRELEPLRVNDAEFFPNAPCALLDIQPKAMDPLFCAMGPDTNRSGHTFELILRGMMAMGAEPISKSIDSVWPGAAEGVLPHCPSVTDRKLGGMPLGGYGELSARILNERQWTEILSAWMNWPFRPTLSQLVGRVDDSEVEQVDDLGAFE